MNKWYGVVYRVDAGDEQAGTRNGTVEHLEGEVSVLWAQRKALDDSSGQVLEGPRRAALLETVVAPVQPIQAHQFTRKHTIVVNFRHKAQEVNMLLSVR